MNKEGIKIMIKIMNRSREWQVHAARAKQSPRRSLIRSQLPKRTMHNFITLACLSVLCALTASLHAQAPDVPIVRDRGETFTALIEKANQQRIAGHLLGMKEVRAQLNRTHCTINLPKAARKNLEDTDVWRRSRESHVRVGWHYLCQKCEHWHQNLAGGYFVTADGVVATCYHVIEPGKDFREAYLVVATEGGELLPVLEVLAANERTDAALIRTKIASPVKPLPLNTNVTPGDAAWCYSDPLGRSSYFSKGMVNRFYFQKRETNETVRMEVSTDWAPGSSGSAIVDVCGNAIGHVSEISSGSSLRSRGTNQPSRGSTALIVFHSGVRAADVRALVQKPD